MRAGYAQARAIRRRVVRHGRVHARVVQHPGRTSYRREAWRVLRPGGRLECWSMSSARSAWSVSPRNCCNGCFSPCSVVICWASQRAQWNALASWSTRWSDRSSASSSVYRHTRRQLRHRHANSAAKALPECSSAVTPWVIVLAPSSRAPADPLWSPGSSPCSLTGSPTANRDSGPSPGRDHRRPRR